MVKPKVEVLFKGKNKKLIKRTLIYIFELKKIMEFIIHRINKIKDLKLIPNEFGTEIDIRSNGSSLILNHVVIL